MEKQREKRERELRMRDGQKEKMQGLRNETGLS
jgi:hypothetical protein